MELLSVVEVRLLREENVLEHKNIVQMQALADLIVERRRVVGMVPVHVDTGQNCSLKVT